MKITFKKEYDFEDRVTYLVFIDGVNPVCFDDITARVHIYYKNYYSENSRLNIEITLPPYKQGECPQFFKIPSCPNKTKMQLLSIVRSVIKRYLEVKTYLENDNTETDR